MVSKIYISVIEKDTTFKTANICYYDKIKLKVLFITDFVNRHRKG